MLWILALLDMLVVALDFVVVGSRSCMQHVVVACFLGVREHLCIEFCSGSFFSSSNQVNGFLIEGLLR